MKSGKYSRNNFDPEWAGIAIGIAFILIGIICGCSGCAAYNGVIGHPLHVIMEQHRSNEQAEDAKKLGEAMERDTHP